MTSTWLQVQRYLIRVTILVSPSSKFQSYPLRPTIFKIWNCQKLQMHRLTLEWHWTSHKYPVYTKIYPWNRNVLLISLYKLFEVFDILYYSITEDKNDINPHFYISQCLYKCSLWRQAVCHGRFNCIKVKTNCAGKMQSFKTGSLSYQWSFKTSISVTQIT